MRIEASRILVSLIAALTLAACTPTQTTKSAGEQVDDTLITARVKTALARELGAGESLRTDIETFRGRVQLNGFVDSEQKKEEAGRVARSVEGVVEVQNNLRVSESQRSAGEFVDDGILAGRIKAALASDPAVAAHDVNIEVRQGVVQLAGFVDTAEQRSRAAEVARGVKGVQRVDNQLAVKQR